MGGYCVVLVTYSTRREAEKAAKAVVRSGLAACVTVVPGVTSIYRWKGKEQVSREALAVAKTRRALATKLIKFVRSHHSCECPEILALPVTAGSPDYLKWVRENTRG